MSKINLNHLKEIDNISITGYRIIEILKLLMQGPQGEQDINNHLSKYSLVSKSLSKDMICIYINTLRSIGCNISRPTKSNNFKYTLKSHPFTLRLNETEVDGLIDVRNYLSKFDNWELMLDVNKLYSLIINTLDDLSPEKAKLSKILTQSSFLTEKSTEVLEELYMCCREQRLISLNYNSPNSGEKVIEVIADDILFENECFYLWCYNIKLSEIQYLRIDRINEILEIGEEVKDYKPEIILARYVLKGMSKDTYIPRPEEKIIKKTDEFLLIETQVKNKFRFLKQMLQYGPDCIVEEPPFLKQEVANELNSVLRVYENN